MQCKFRLVSGEAFSLDLTGSESVRDVKGLICKKFPEIDPTILKLIVHARVLQDNEIMNTLEITQFESVHIQQKSTRPKVLPVIEEEKGIKEPVSRLVEDLYKHGITREQTESAIRESRGDLFKAFVKLTGKNPNAVRERNLPAEAIAGQNEFTNHARERMERDIANALAGAPAEIRQMLLDRALADIRASGREIPGYPIEELRRNVLARLNGGRPNQGPQRQDPRLAAIARLCQTPAGQILGRNVVIEVFRGSGEDEARAAAALEAMS